jgi:hypothetical protein
MSPVTPFQEVNASFEDWLRDRCAAIGCKVVEKDLKRKHERMRKNPFVFLRATFFRWSTQIEELCPDLAAAPKVLSIGDTHVENFGTWRDGEGRLVWGANDFDEACVIAYPFDLVRLATSARLAPGPSVGESETCAAILRGYSEGLDRPRPGVLDERDLWLRPLVNCPDEKRAKFWEEIKALSTAAPTPQFVQEALIKALPSGAGHVRFATRTAGGGSLGRPRYVTIADWRGGRVVREAKALVPSAWDWAHGLMAAPHRFADLAMAVTRAPDPYMTVIASFIIRRLAPDSRKAELGDDPDAQLEKTLLEAMGREIGSLHAATADVEAVQKDMQIRDADWLHAASKKAGQAVEEDFKTWASSTGIGLTPGRMVPSSGTGSP